MSIYIEFSKTGPSFVSLELALNFLTVVASCPPHVCRCFNFFLSSRRWQIYLILVLDMPQFHNPPQAAIKQGVCVTDDMPIRPYANRLQYGLWERLQSSGENNETDNSVKNSRMITIHQRHFLLFSFCEKNRQRKKKKITAPPKISAFQIKCVDLPQIQHMLFSGKSFLRMKHFLLCENWNLLWPHEIDEFNEFCWSFLWRVTFLFFFGFFLLEI